MCIAQRVLHVTRTPSASSCFTSQPATPRASPTPTPTSALPHAHPVLCILRHAQFTNLKEKRDADLLILPTDAALFEDDGFRCGGRVKVGSVRVCEGVCMWQASVVTAWTARPGCGLTRCVMWRTCMAMTHSSHHQTLALRPSR